MSDPLDHDDALAGTASLVVGEDDLATRLNQHPGDAFPPVFATARMIGLMELAAARALQPRLAEGELSVGVSIDVGHGAATCLGAEVKASARLVGREGRLYVFEVVAHDPGGEIGHGLHRRAIVATDRLLAGARRRGGSVD